MTVKKNPLYEAIRDTWSDEKDVFIKRMVFNQIRENEKLQLCSPDSIIAAVKEGLACHLIPGRHFYIVPYGKVATCMYDWKAYQEFCYRSPKVLLLQVACVRAADEFGVDFANGAVTHKLRLGTEAANKEATKVLYAYARAWLRDAPIPLLEVLDPPQIEQIKSCAKTTKFWDKWPGEMAKKSVLRRLIKHVPGIQFPDLQAIAADDRRHNEVKDVTNSDVQQIDKQSELPSPQEDELVQESAQMLGQAFETIEV